MREKNMEKKRLLVVEDEIDLLELLSKRLVKAGFDVTPAQNGVIAVEFIKRQTYDAIVCDINMPGGVSGFDVFEFLRSQTTSRPPFVFVTGHGEGTPEMDRALNLGVDGVFSKPVSSKVLIDHITKLCENALSKKASA
jgi:two-component system response regulator GlrR